MEVLFNFIKAHSDILILYCGIANVLALILLMVQIFKTSKLAKRYRNLARGIDGKNLEEAINQYYEKIENVEIRINKVNHHLENIDEKLLRCVQKVGIVRFNAFNDAGGDQSFSIALLDERQNGFIITSIYGRNHSVVYGKPIKAGKSSYTLSAEELQALDRAKSNSLDEYAKMIS